MRLSTPLSAKLGLASPNVQAPMAGGPSSQELEAETIQSIQKLKGVLYES